MLNAIRLLPILLPLAISACAPAPSTAPGVEPRGAAERGALVADRSCSLCHQVSVALPSQQEAAAPSFMEIANLPGRNRDYLRRFATQRHVVETVGEPKPVMPTVYLSPEDREDVVAYILAFQRPDAPVAEPAKKLEPFE
jgi:mono/diheme cytochrome c family protein